MREKKMKKVITIVLILNILMLSACSTAGRISYPIETKWRPINVSVSLR